MTWTSKYKWISDCEDIRFCYVSLVRNQATMTIDW